MRPGHWLAYKIHYRYRETVYHISIERSAAPSESVIRVTVDGVAVGGAGVDGAGRLQGIIPLVDDHQEHHVEVALS